ncbi:MAG TPA: GNAT family N-acetyltransferase [Burkholderiaceae bacterium]|nr:GNAT family N-acetyltransferase [Burkholderiaceae bacterium]
MNPAAAPGEPRVRRLLSADAAVYQALRLRALREHPQAFTSSVEDEQDRPPAWAQARLREDPLRPHDLFLGAFLDEVLVGVVGLQGRYRAKERHNATVVGMYVAPEAAGRGLGQALMHELLARAQALPALAQLDLTVTEGNDAAQSLYARCGFAVFGVQPNAIRLDGRELAKVHMGLRLR